MTPQIVPEIVMFSVSIERPADGLAIEALLDRAFGPGRQAKQSYRYRDGVAPIPGLRLVARDVSGGAPAGRALVGTVRCWPVLIGSTAATQQAAPAVLLGPLAVEPKLAGQGIGRALMWTALDFAACDGYRLVLLVGDLDYYGRFGFVPAAAHGLVMPEEKPERLLVHALDPAALGTIRGELMPAASRKRRTAA
jgi:predicted N-acetyltransferase YhbS